MAQPRDLEMGPVGSNHHDCLSTRSLLTASGREGDATAATLSLAKSARASLMCHRDAFGRTPNEWEVDVGKEAFLDPLDGRLRRLNVQRHNSESTSDGGKLPPWTCHDLTAASAPNLVKLVDSVYREGANTGIYIPAVLWMTICLFCFAKVEIKVEDQGQYRPVLYRDWSRPGIARNPREDYFAHFPRNPRRRSMSNKIDGQQASTYARKYIERRPMPHYLCYVQDIDLASIMPETVVARKVQDDVFDEYVFVSYTRKHFGTDYKQLQGDTTTSRLIAHENRLALLKIGVQAARKAGVPAFWLDCFPVVDAHEDKEEVYRICDIVRASHSIVVAIDTHVDASTGPVYDQRERDALRVWGNRLWTLPELLLAPSGKKVTIFDRQRHGLPPKSYSRRALGSLAWRVVTPNAGLEEDWAHTSQLLDHFEGNQHLSRLELIDIAHASLRRRQMEIRKPGDVAYALMGLLRRRPAAADGDSDFVAFARLSLSNDSDSILERLLCMQPTSSRALWHDMVDAFGARLFDIEPICQIAAIDEDVVAKSAPMAAKQNSTTMFVLDGAYGATIQWAKIELVPFFKRSTNVRRFTKKVLPIAPWLLLLSLFFLLLGIGVVKEDGNSFVADVYLGIVSISIIAFSLVLCAGPALLRNLYYGKFWSTQARFFGVQGQCDLETLEHKIFGLKDKRLKWSTNGSLLARPAKNTEYYMGAPPTSGLKLQNAECQFLFTLVDTYVLEATVFYAERPPSVVMICGKEGGMLRAVLCSYDYHTQTFCREVVLRMKTIVLNRMARVDKFRFALTRPR